MKWPPKKKHLEYKKIDPRAKFSFIRHTPNFEYIFEIKPRFFDPSEIMRADQIISKDGMIVARIVNYNVGIPRFAHYQAFNCIIYDEELYAKQELSYE